MCEVVPGKARMFIGFYWERQKVWFTVINPNMGSSIGAGIVVLHCYTNATTLSYIARLQHTTLHFITPYYITLHFITP